MPKNWEERENAYIRLMHMMGQKVPLWQSVQVLRLSHRWPLHRWHLCLWRRNKSRIRVKDKTRTKRNIDSARDYYPAFFVY